jgi:hypothetical protein
MAGMGSRRSSAVVVIVLLHLAGFGALFGFLLPVEARLGGERMVLFVAYLLGLRWAFDPVNVATIGAADRRLDSLGRSSVASASWFAAGFAATVAGLAFLFTVVLRTLARTDPRLTPDGSLTWLFLGVLGAVQLVVLAGAVRCGGGVPVSRPSRAAPTASPAGSGVRCSFFRSGRSLGSVPVRPRRSGCSCWPEGSSRSGCRPI